MIVSIAWEIWIKSNAEAYWESFGITENKDSSVSMIGIPISSMINEESMPDAERSVARSECKLRILAVGGSMSDWIQRIKPWKIRTHRIEP